MIQTRVWTGVARRTLTESKLGHYQIARNEGSEFLMGGTSMQELSMGRVNNLKPQDANPQPSWGPFGSTSLFGWMRMQPKSDARHCKRNQIRRPLRQGYAFAANDGPDSLIFLRRSSQNVSGISRNTFTICGSN
jgi:hypothetical protein